MSEDDDERDFTSFQNDQEELATTIDFIGSTLQSAAGLVMGRLRPFTREERVKFVDAVNKVHAAALDAYVVARQLGEGGTVEARQLITVADSERARWEPIVQEVARGQCQCGLGKCLPCVARATLAGRPLSKEEKDRIK